MNLGVPTLGAMSIYFLVGYLASLSGLILSLDIKTAFYTSYSGLCRNPLLLPWWLQRPLC
jgi:hypothetical protein